jgi:hypothetical protein
VPQRLGSQARDRRVLQADAESRLSANTSRDRSCRRFCARNSSINALCARILR